MELLDSASEKVEKCLCKHTAARQRGIMEVVNLPSVLYVLISSNAILQFLHINDVCVFLTTFILIDNRN